MKPSKTRRTVSKSKSRMSPNSVLCLFGRLRDIGKCVAYCDYHKCYMEPMDIKERKCNSKKCKYLCELGKYKDIEGRGRL